MENLRAAELRIGNLVYRQGYELIVDGCDIKWFQEGSYNGLEPIPLTEEWLVIFGFDIANKIWNKKGFEVHIHNYNNGDRIDFIIVYKQSVIKLLKNEVHLLQNLYFALTGEELILKSK